MSQNVDDLVDSKLIDLLKACSLLRYPPIEELKPKMVTLGPRQKQKLLILDMDETMLHTSFENNLSNECAPAAL